EADRVPPVLRRPLAQRHRRARGRRAGNRVRDARAGQGGACPSARPGRDAGRREGGDPMNDALDTALLERFAAQHDPVAARAFGDVARRAQRLRPPAGARRRHRRRLVVAIALAALVLAGAATAVGRHFLGGSVSYTVVPLTSAGAVPGLL